MAGFDDKAMWEAEALIDKEAKEMWEAEVLMNEEKNHGYHISDIPRGEFGELSKIKEEIEEAIDADKQGVRIMTLVELSDVIGSIEGYLQKHFPDMTLEDLRSMSNVTQRAFRSGTRKARD